MIRLRPAWYLTPYMCWLGFIDWLSKRAVLTHEEAYQEIKQEFRDKSHASLQRLGIALALFMLLILLAAQVFAPAIEGIAPQVPRQSVVPIAGTLAFLSVFAITLLVARAVGQFFSRAYMRGLRVWKQRQGLYVG